MINSNYISKFIKIKKVGTSFKNIFYYTILFAAILASIAWLIESKESGLMYDILIEYDKTHSIYTIFGNQKFELIYFSLLLVKLYIVGIVFFLYCKYRTLPDFSAVCGALTYTFGSLIIYVYTKQPVLFSLFISFPLLIIGLEKITRREKILFLFFVVIYSALNGCEVLYISTFLLIIYYFLNYLTMTNLYYKKQYLRQGIKAIFAYFFGITIAFVIALLAVKFVQSLSDFKKTFTLNYLFIYFFDYKIQNTTEIFYNRGLPPLFIKTFVTSVSLICIPLAFFRCKRKHLYLNYMLVFLTILFSIFVKTKAGLYVDFYIWGAIYCFIISGITSCNITKIKRIRKKEISIIFLLLIIMTVLSIFNYMLNDANIHFSFITLWMTFSVFLIIRYVLTNKRLIQIILICLLSFNLIINGYLSALNYL